jgi:hypothetical protein
MATRGRQLTARLPFLQSAQIRAARHSCSPGKILSLEQSPQHDGDETTHIVLRVVAVRRSVRVYVAQSALPCHAIHGFPLCDSVHQKRDADLVPSVCVLAAANVHSACVTAAPKTLRSQLQNELVCGCTGLFNVEDDSVKSQRDSRRTQNVIWLERYSPEMAQNSKWVSVR